MQVPNWKHHSRKEKKRKLKPQAMRARREALRQFKKRYTGSSKGRPFLYTGLIDKETHASSTRNQVTTCQTACN